MTYTIVRNNIFVSIADKEEDVNGRTRIVVWTIVRDYSAIYSAIYDRNT